MWERGKWLGMRNANQIWKQNLKRRNENKAKPLGDSVLHFLYVSIKHLQATLMMLITSLIFWCFWKHQSEGPRRLQFIKIPDKKNSFFCFGLIGMDILLLLILCFQGLSEKEGRDRRKIIKSFEVGMNGAEMQFIITLQRSVKILQTTFCLFWFV